ncbi:hypothetical protein L6R29_01840 [Myxococcota bacterium]|nr:hypothetical protein [Myxococcota bacterium]
MRAWIVVCVFFCVCGLWACERPLVCRGGEQLVQGRCVAGDGVSEERTVEKAEQEGGSDGGFDTMAEAQGSESEGVAEAVLEEGREVSIEGSVVCRTSVSRCRDAQTVEVCNAAGDAWVAQRCEQGRVCIEGRCAVEGCGAEGSERSCYTGPMGTSGVGLCKGGTQRCEGGRWGGCVGEVLPKAEVCGNNADENCDGKVDEGCVPVSVLVGSWHRRNETAPPYRFQITFLSGGAYEMFHDQQKIAEGTYTLQGDQLEVLDAAGTNCTKSHPTQPKGVYRVVLSGDQLTIQAVRDLCFSREGYLTFDPWVKIP